MLCDNRKIPTISGDGVRMGRIAVQVTKGLPQKNPRVG